MGCERNEPKYLRIIFEGGDLACYFYENSLIQFSLSELTKRNPLFPAHLCHLTFVGGDQFNQS